MPRRGVGLPCIRIFTRAFASCSSIASKTFSLRGSSGRTLVVERFARSTTGFGERVQVDDASVQHAGTTCSRSVGKEGARRAIHGGRESAGMTTAGRVAGRFAENVGQTAFACKFAVLLSGTCCAGTVEGVV